MLEPLAVLVRQKLHFHLLVTYLHGAFLIIFPLLFSLIMVLVLTMKITGCLLMEMQQGRYS